MELSPLEREKIYLEERSRREARSSSPLLFLLTLGAAAGLAALLLIAREKNGSLSIEDLRKAYEGLSPEEEQQQ
jgi:hypothetical protein